MDYITRLKQIGITLIDQFSTAKQHHNMSCDVCNHIWNATPISKLQNFKKYKVNGCPNCNINRKKTTNEKTRNNFIQQIIGLGFTILDKDYDGKQTTQHRISVRRDKCGHEFLCAPGNLVHRGVDCPVCNTERKTVVLKQCNDMKHTNYIKTANQWQIYKSSVRSLTRLQYNNHKNIINPHNFKRGIAGGDGYYQLDHIISIRTCFELGVPVDIACSVENLQMIPWVDNLSKSSRVINSTIPLLIRPYIIKNTILSCLLEIEEFLKTKNVHIEINSFVLVPYQVNIWIPDFQLAICVYDITLPITSNILKNKIDIANKLGIKIVQIFSDEWINNKTLVLNKIQHLCGINNQSVVVYARKCEIKEIGYVSKNKFLDEFHIQGHDKSQISLGAFSGNDLLAVMTFTIPRILMGRVIAAGKWELSRFATNTSYRIPGIASKLLSFFKKNYDWQQIYSYADARWGTGNVYHQLGFKLIHHNRPNYWYIVNHTRKHRWGFRKDALRDKFPEIYSSDKTEFEMTQSLGINRIYDGGTLLFSIEKDIK